MSEEFPKPIKFRHKEHENVKIVKNFTCIEILLLYTESQLSIYLYERINYVVKHTKNIFIS